MFIAGKRVDQSHGPRRPSTISTSSKRPEDLDGNGVVDFADLLLVLVAWGPCPVVTIEAADGCAEYELTINRR